jgi:RimJ/RimL family protein N-acetyltransferase
MAPAPEAFGALAQVLGDEIVLAPSPDPETLFRAHAQACWDDLRNHSVEASHSPVPILASFAEHCFYFAEIIAKAKAKPAPAPPPPPQSNSAGNFALMRELSEHEDPFREPQAAPEYPWKEQATPPGTTETGASGVDAYYQSWENPPLPARPLPDPLAWPSGSRTSEFPEDAWEYRRTEFRALPDRHRLALTPPPPAFTEASHTYNNNQNDPFETRFAQLEEEQWESWSKPMEHHRDLMASQKTVGYVYLTVTPPDNVPAGEVNIGVVIGSQYRRSGFARRAIEQVLAWCFEDLGLHRIQAVILNPSKNDNVRRLFTQM